MPAKRTNGGPEHAMSGRARELLEQLIEAYGPALAEMLLKKLLGALASKAMDQHANDFLKAATEVPHEPAPAPEPAAAQP